MNLKWQCACGKTATGYFCGDCGAKCTLTASDFGNHVRNDIKAFLRRPSLLFIVICNTLGTALTAFYLAFALFSTIYLGDSIAVKSILSYLLSAVSLAVSVYICISLWRIRKGSKDADFLLDIDGLRSLSRAVFFARIMTYISYGFLAIATVSEYAAQSAYGVYNYTAFIPVVIVIVLLVTVAYHFFYLYLQRCVDSIIARIEEPTAKTYVKSTPAAVVSFIFMGVFAALGLIMLLVDFVMLITAPIMRAEAGAYFNFIVTIYVAATVISALLVLFWLFLALYILKYNKLEFEYATYSAELQFPNNTYSEALDKLHIN